MDEAGVFRKISRIDDSRLASLFAREVLADLVRKELLSPDWAGRLLSWRHSGFNVHSRVRAKTKREAERVGKYMIRPLLSLERLSFTDLWSGLFTALWTLSAAQWFIHTHPEPDLTRAKLRFIIVNVFLDGSRLFRWRDTRLASAAEKRISYNES